MIFGFLFFFFFLNNSSVTSRVDVHRTASCQNVLKQNIEFYTFYYEGTTCKVSVGAGVINQNLFQGCIFYYVISGGVEDVPVSAHHRQD